MKLAIIPVNSIAICSTRWMENINEKNFWAKMIELLNQNNYEEDLLMKMMKIQVTSRPPKTAGPLLRQVKNFFRFRPLAIFAISPINSMTT